MLCGWLVGSSWLVAADDALRRLVAGRESIIWTWSGLVAEKWLVCGTNKHNGGASEEMHATGQREWK